MSIKMNIDERLLGNDSNGDAVVEVDGNSVGECLNHLVKQQPTLKKEIFDEDGNLNYIQIFVNQEFILSEKLAKAVKDGDEISVVALGGGCCS
ncbi:MoaD/ThiS family protein [Chloroflexota bacterium]